MNFSDHCWWETFLLSWERIGSDASWDLAWVLAGDSVARLEAAQPPFSCDECIGDHGRHEACNGLGRDEAYWNARRYMGHDAAARAGF